MRNFKIISATPREHYKMRKGFDVIMETPIRGKQKTQTKTWLPEAQYNLVMFMQENYVLDNFHKKDAEKFLDLIEKFGQEKYEEGSYDESLVNS